MLSPYSLLYYSLNAKKTSYKYDVFLEAPPGFEPGNKGFADLDLTAWL